MIPARLWRQEEETCNIQMRADLRCLATTMFFYMSRTSVCRQLPGAVCQITCKPKLKHLQTGRARSEKCLMLVQSMLGKGLRVRKTARNNNRLGSPLDHLAVLVV